MRISVQSIVFNGASIMPRGMLRACIEAMLPHVDQYVIVCGATKALRANWDGDCSTLTPDGRCTDGTIQAIHSIPDPSRKITVIPSRGWWDGKTAMMNAGLERCDGDYVWQIDADEFYHEKELPMILQLLDEVRPDAMHFNAFHFWGGFDHCMDEAETKWANEIPWRRIFRREPGAKWKSHEPPDLLLANGKSCNAGRVLTRDDTLNFGLHLYHYGYCWKSQARFKQAFYRNPIYLKLWDAWQKNHAMPLVNGSRTKPFEGEHPAAIRKLIEDLKMRNFASA